MHCSPSDPVKLIAAAAIAEAPALSENWNVNDCEEPLPEEGVTEIGTGVVFCDALPNRRTQPVEAAWKAELMAFTTGKFGEFV